MLAPYLMQMSCTIVAPSFLTAAMFSLFVHIISLVGHEYSRIPSKIYSHVFTTIDFIALAIQFAGGGIAASHKGANRGVHIMMGGLVLQTVGMALFVLAFVDYTWRVHRQQQRPKQSPQNLAPIVDDRPSYPIWSSLFNFWCPHHDTDTTRLHAEKSPSDWTDDQIVPTNTSRQGRGGQKWTRGVNIMAIGLAICTLLVFIRTGYRTVEMKDGWEGPIITNQVLFDCLDGLPIFASMLTFNILHPGRLVPEQEPELRSSSRLDLVTVV
ncbi:hypothetical protein FRB94_006932 [Tulasnella sp. JGI-2019a]|nr:hypothetical protein FRB94_006932 [Tulasnella sp. JGI-2019a]